MQRLPASGEAGDHEIVVALNAADHGMWEKVAGQNRPLDRSVTSCGIDGPKQMLDCPVKRSTIIVWKLTFRSVLWCAFRLRMEGIYAETAGHVGRRGLNFLGSSTVDPLC